MQFRLIYVREAHAVDGPAPPREGDGPQIHDPKTMAERGHVAGECLAGLELSAIPTLVDELDDAVGRAYAAHPDRLYLLSADGKVAWKCAKGPQGFDPDGMEAAIRKLLRLDR